MSDKIRNRLVDEILAKDKSILRKDALKQANKIMNERKAGRNTASKKSNKPNPMLRIVQELGFKTISEYFASPLFRSIYDRIKLLNPKCSCTNCDKDSYKLMFGSVTKKALAGEDDSFITIVCTDCLKKLNI